MHFSQGSHKKKGDNGDFYDLAKEIRDTLKDYSTESHDELEFKGLTPDHEADGVLRCKLKFEGFVYL
ncbi:hypothetical protein [Xanthovirga aplysinae]|uniref:hypothetical protein n=1 Tax=Xanthovirga aplysinae TaxID=2529853 RepID=UPI0012BBC169|nr:hypothetical protein [Xanthovirga aplysinae]MTI31416.1 hypothetical protein [Xanthovirga aplysinae]